MSSSRSDDVTNSVCLSVCSHSSSLVYLMPHMCLKVVLRVLDNFQGCSKSVPFPRMFQVCFTGVLMMFHGCSKSVFGVCCLEKFQRCFKKVSWTFQKSFKGVSRKFPGCFKEVSRVFQGSFKGVSKKFQGCFKEVSRMFQESFKGVS